MPARVQALAGPPGGVLQRRPGGRPLDRHLVCMCALVSVLLWTTPAPAGSGCSPGGSGRSNTTATLGDHDVTLEEGPEQHIHTDLTVLHRPYRSPLHSLAMVRLARPARFTPYVQPLALPSRCPQPGESCLVSGWGSTVPNQGE